MREIASVRNSLHSDGLNYSTGTLYIQAAPAPVAGQILKVSPTLDSQGNFQAIFGYPTNIGGVEISGTPGLNKIIIGTSDTAAEWVASSTISPSDYVQLQASYPGTQQTGNINVSGNIYGNFVGSIDTAIINDDFILSSASYYEDILHIDDTDSPYSIVYDGYLSTVFIDATSGDVQVLLYSITEVLNRVIRFKRTDNSANTVTIIPDGIEVIDGAATLVLAGYGHCRLTSDATGWYTT